MYYILMADIVKSGEAVQKSLMSDFKYIVGEINKKDKEQILSPLTITLGDEFQGVMRDLKSALKVMIDLEEMIIVNTMAFKLRYVLVEGTIETEINRKMAYEMLGPGLTEARQTLEGLKQTKERFHIKIGNRRLSEILNKAFLAIQSIIDKWNEKDMYIAAKFIEKSDYKLVAEELKKDRALIWKREKGLNIPEYQALKEVIEYLGTIK